MNYHTQWHANNREKSRQYAKEYYKRKKMKELKEKIQDTQTYKNEVKRTPFLKNTLLLPSNIAVISEWLGIANRLGIEYLDDKKISSRDRKIIMEVYLMNGK